MTFEICGIGECMIEFCALEPLGIAKTMQRSYGGDVLNALVAAQRLGSKSAFITRVGNDPFGLALMHAWQAEGINIDQVSLVDGQNGVYFISLQENGEREFSYYRTNSAASQITPADLKPKVIASSSMLLISGITQAISQSAQSTTLQAARIAREAGNTVVFDPNYRPKLWEARGGIQVAREAYQELIPYVDLLLPSNPADLDLLEQTNLVPRKVLENLLKQHPNQIVALKCGEDGVWIASEGLIDHVGAAKVATVIDSTGAGDAWNGAFLHHHLKNLKRPKLENLRLSAQAANIHAAATLQHRGAIPPRSEVSYETRW